MNKKLIGYWMLTALIALAMAAGGVFDITLSPEILEAMEHLGYPAYFARILGIWKVLGALAILAPGLKLVKEWAYAGIAIDLIMAALSHISVGDGPDQFVAPMVLLLVLVGSYVLRPENRRLV